MSALSSLLHPGRAYRSAANELNNYYGQSQNFLSPYQQQGQSAYEPMQNAMQSLLNPADLHNQWAQGYEISPYAQQMQSMAQQNGLNAASSMGLMGSTPALQAIQAGTSQIANRDRENYLNDLMQKYMTGASLAQGLYGSGQQAAMQGSQNALGHGQNMAEMLYGGKQAGANMLGNVLGTVSGFGMLKSLMENPEFAKKAGGAMGMF